MRCKFNSKVFFCIVLIIIINLHFSKKFLFQEVTGTEITFVKLSQISTTGRSDYIEIVNDTCFVFDFVNGFYSYDISNPNNPVLLDRIFFTNNFDPNVKGGHDFVIDNHIAIVNFIHSGIKIIDISSPNNLIVLDEWDTGGEYYYLSCEGNRIYCGKAGNGIEILELSDSYQLSSIGSFNDGNDLYFIHCNRNILFVVDFNIFKTRIFDVVDPLNIIDLGNIDSMIYDAKFFDNIMYAACGSEGFRIFNISDNIVKPTLLSRYYDGGKCYDINFVQNYAFLADHDDGLEVIDTTNILNLTEVAQYSYGTCVNIGIYGNNAILAKQDNGWEIVEFQGLVTSELSTSKVINSSNISSNTVMTSSDTSLSTTITNTTSIFIKSTSANSFVFYFVSFAIFVRKRLFISKPKKKI